MSIATTASMPTTIDGLSSATPAKRARSPRATSRQSAPVSARAKKASFYLSAAAVKRLAVAATMSDKSSSELLEEILAESATLKRWVVSDRAKTAGQAMVEVSSD